MNSRKKAEGNRLTDIGSAVQDLVRELQENISVWAKDPHPLAEKIKFFSLEQQKIFFRRTLENAGEKNLSVLENLALQDEPLGLIILEVLGEWGSPRTGELLQQLGSRKTSKTIAKAIRRTAFRLKSRGIAVPMADDRAPAVFRPPESAVSEGFLGPVDVNGERMVWLTKPQIPKGIVAFTAHIDIDEGIIEFSGVETSRKNFHEYLASLPQEYTEDLVEADSTYCYRLIGEAQQAGQDKGQASSTEFLKWQHFLGPIPPPQKPLIYRFLSEEEVNARSEPMASAALLWETTLFRNWLLKKEECQKYIDLLQETFSSRLVLAPYQKESRVLEIYQQAIRELFNLRRRHQLRRALEENAYIIWKKGKAAEARACLAMTRRLEEDMGVLSSHPFLEELVKRSMAFFLDGHPEEKSADVPLIVRP